MPSRLSVLPAEAVTDPRLTDGDVRVLAAIGTFTDRDGKCWPSVQAVARVSSRSPRSVQRSMAVLAELGYLHRVKRWGRSNVYVVKLDTPATSVTPDISVVGGVTPASPTPDTSVTHNVPRNGSKGTQLVGWEEAVELRPEQQVCKAANQALLNNPRVNTGEIQIRPLTAAKAEQCVIDWTRDGIPLATIIAAVERTCLAFVPSKENPRIGSFRYFDSAVRKAHKGSQPDTSDQRMAEVISRMQQDYERGVL